MKQKLKIKELSCSECKMKLSGFNELIKHYKLHEDNL